MASMCLLLLFLTSCSAKGQWDYSKGPGGPAHWVGVAAACGGDHQSPIDITGAKVATHAPLQLEHYSTAPTQAHLENNGHTAKLTLLPSSPATTPTLLGGGLPARYSFAQVHFHWGAEDGRGSEHLVAGQAAPLEMHLVHFKSALGNLTGALEEGAPDSLAVLGILFQVGSANPGLEQLLPRLPEMRNNSKITDAPLVSLTSLLDTADLTSFYRYSGSLTTPTCNEIVQWTVVESPISVSREQLAALRSLQDAHGQPLVDNYRPVQSVGARRVTHVTTRPLLRTAGFLGSGGAPGPVVCPLLLTLLLVCSPALY